MRFWLGMTMALWLAAAGTSAAEVDYQRDIKPLLAAKCAACHGALKQESGLRLDAGVLIHQGSAEGPVIVPGNPGNSRMLERVTTSDPDLQMPPPGEGERLTNDQLGKLTAWIAAGAVVPDGETIPVDPREHWSFQPVQKPNVPADVAAEWSHPIDAFLAREHTRLGLTPVDLADRATLLRRIYLDVAGLPPTPQQLRAFVDDTSPDAWQRVVDSLLDSPRYGERWGRHWMDVWRYSDWDGYKNELRGSQRHIWHWRDWIIESLNADKGYDQMVVEMLAADEFAPHDRSALSATGFLARNFHNRNRNIWLDATVEHTAKAFLGLTLNCARCHDHKYDPLPQTAYYQFRAIFEPHHVRTDLLPGESDLMKNGLPRAFDKDLAAATYVYLRGNDKHPDKEHPLSAAVPDVLGGSFDIEPVELPVDSYYPWLQDHVVEEKLAAAKKKLEAATRQLAAAANSQEEKAGSIGAGAAGENSLVALRHAVAEKELSSLEARIAADRAKYQSVDVPSDESAIAELARTAAVFERELNVLRAELAVATQQQAVAQAETAVGALPDKDSDKDAQKKATDALAKARKELAESQEKLRAAQGALEKTDASYTPLGDEYPRTSSGRRLALARWIANPAHPLTARVAVNHIWLRHFGTPLVENVYDFGLRSPRPRHAELLDWLAAELMENRWSMKHVHRLILTSRAWRLASSASGPDAAHNVARDPDNHYLWRMNVRRLDAEIVRDSLLAVSGQLDLTQGGPDIDFRDGESSRRRSVYLRHAYEKQMTMMVVFDAASPTECYRRSESVVPQQALALVNSSLSLGEARRLAGQLSSVETNRSDADFVASAFLHVLSRPPTDDESAACQEFLTEQASTLADATKLTTYSGGAKPVVKPAADPRQRARENLVLVLLNHNDFVTVR